MNMPPTVGPVVQNSNLNNGSVVFLRGLSLQTALVVVAKMECGNKREGTRCVVKLQ